MARAGRWGRRPGDGPLTIDLDSTICETYCGSGLHRLTGGRAAPRRVHHHLPGWIGFLSPACSAALAAREPATTVLMAGSEGWQFARFTTVPGRRSPLLRIRRWGDVRYGGARGRSHGDWADQRLLATHAHRRRWPQDGSCGPSPSASTSRLRNIMPASGPCAEAVTVLDAWVVPTGWSGAVHCVGVARPIYDPFQDEARPPAPVRLIVRRVEAHARLASWHPLFSQLQLSRLHTTDRLTGTWSWNWLGRPSGSHDGDRERHPSSSTA